MAGNETRGDAKETKFDGFWIWKEEMDRHELWPRMSKAVASRHLETRDEREPVRTTEAPQHSRKRGAFVPSSLRTNETDTEPF